MKTLILRRFTLTISSILFIGFIYSQTPQNSFVIIENGNAENISDYQNAIQNADFESYRLRNDRLQLSFDNGLKFELVSAYEMQQLGYNIDPINYKENNPLNYQPPVLILGSNGMIGAQHSINPNRKY